MCALEFFSNAVLLALTSYKIMWRDTKRERKWAEREIERKKERERERKREKGRDKSEAKEEKWRADVKGCVTA